MLKLPKIPYNMEKNRQQVVSMGNINYSKMTRDGDVADSKGISCRQYPYITTAKGNKNVDDSDAISMTYFRDKWVKVDASGELYYGDKLVGRLGSGEKQFAAINTKLVIMPDKKYLDASGDEAVLKDLGAEVNSSVSTLTANSLSIIKNYKMAGTLKFNKEAGSFTFTPDEADAGEEHCTIAVASSKSSLRLSFVKMLFSNYVEFDSSTVFRTWINTGEVVPKTPFRAYISYTDGTGDWYNINSITEDEYNTSSVEYCYFELDKPYERYTESTRRQFLEMHIEDWDKWYTPASDGINTKLIYAGKEIFIEVYICSTYTDIYAYRYSGDGAKLSSGILYDVAINNGGWSGSLGNIVKSNEAVLFEIQTGSVKDSGIGKKYEGSGTVSGTSDASVTIGNIELLSEGELPTGETSVVITLSSLGGSPVKLDKVFIPGDVVAVSETSTNKEVSFRIDSIGGKGSMLVAASDVFSDTVFEGAIKIERRIPDLDFICVHDNRLYGCSNKDNTIYVSALGDPTNIYTYRGLSTDSYSVAVASEGKFTGCCPYDGGVLFWKENTLHKLLGSYPAEYALYTYNIEGVQKGSHRSLQNIGEIIYYKGARGVFAFDGSPRLISESFGEKRFKNAVAGNDGESYYISMEEDLGDEQVRDHFFSYNTRTGIWVREDEARVSQFVKNDQGLYMLKKKVDGGENDNGEVYLYGASETGSDSEWYVQFTPIYETIEGKKSYSRIKMRAEIPRGSYMAISVRCDGGSWAECGKVVGKREGIVPVMVPVNRCDKFELKISGKGPCTIHSILREYYVGGDR